ncbi:XRE family transcriptional regulator [Acidovorax sp. NO-1]|uniref:helix-turn-helix domain-containing protein n=1 Tax=Acidovorax sp. NO-1 TaxID=512030 RepID=UPI00023FCCBC|nr:helix-turn-helix transcriptional regulator [Acidovorax sp. NO-1]EHL24863.1 XRE family transcriptional regulator [Acidovorax sp. NO-1]
MKTLADFSISLLTAKAQRGVKLKDLARNTGLSPVAVRQMLDGKVSPRLANAMAVASELGLELVLMPKAVAASFEQSTAGERTVLSDLERRLGDATTNQVGLPSIGRGTGPKP